MKSERLSAPATCVLVAVLAVAAAVRFWGLGFGLPYTQARPDETFIIDTAHAFLRGNFRPAFYDYPWLYMFVTAILHLGYFVWGVATGLFHSTADMLASWRVHWEPFFLITRALSATLGTATVFVLFRMGSRLWDTATGLTAAFFMSLAFLPARDAHFGTTDTMMTLLIVASVALVIDAHRTSRRSTFIWAGVVGGLAAATKYNAVLLAVVPIASYVLNLVQSSDRRQAARDPRVVLYGVPCLLAFAIGIPFVVFDTQRFLTAMDLLKSSMAIGQPRLGLSAGWIHHLEFSLRYGIGIPLLVAGILGMAAMVRWEPASAMLLLSFPVTYYVVAGSIRNLFFRYAIPLVPFLCLAAARLIARTVDAVGNRVAGGFSRTTRAAMLAVAAAVVVAPSATSLWQFDRIVSQDDNRVVVARWFVDNVPAGDSILQTGSRYGLVQFDVSKKKNVYWAWDGARGMFLVDGHRATGRPDWILVQDSPLPSSTQQAAVELLRDHYTFVANFSAFSPDPSLVYDQQDAFFAPFAGFGNVSRPGPNFSVFKRADLPDRDAAQSR